MIDRAIDGVTLGLIDDTELGMDDGMQEGTAVGVTLGVRVSDALG